MTSLRYHMAQAEARRCKEDLETLLEKACRYDDLNDDNGSSSIAARDRIFVQLGLVEDWLEQREEQG